MSRWPVASALVGAALVLGGWATRPQPLVAPQHTQDFATTEVAAELAAREAAVDRLHGIIDGADKRVAWYGAPGQRTERVVIYLHGFSATRQEIAPVPQQLAAALGANLFETRLAGHGLERDALAGTTAEEWLRDGEEALAVGAALGDELIVMGTSTGATLAVALAQHPQFAQVRALVLLSPNFGPAAAGAGLATGPFGPQLVRLLAGEERSWEAANDLQEKYWSTRYPNAAVVEMMRLVNLANAELRNVEVPQAVLVYSEQDQVVSVPQFKAAFEALRARQKDVIRIDSGGGPSRHVLAGDILAPENTAPLVSRLASRLRRDAVESS